MIKTAYKTLHGFKLEVLVYRTNSGANGIGPRGQLSDPKLAKISDKRQKKSNAASISVGQAPKDKGLAAIDNDVAARVIIQALTSLILGIENPVKVRKGKPSKARGHDKLTRTIQRRESTNRSKPRGRRKDARVFRSVTALLALR